MIISCPASLGVSSSWWSHRLK